MKRFVAEFFLAISLASTATAGPVIEEGSSAYRSASDADAALERGDHATALRLTRQLAEDGYAHGQYNLGHMYDEGIGVPQDHAEAAKWYRLAGEQGHTSAQFNLAIKYYYGRGVAQDHAEAAKWYRLAGEQGLVKAQAMLGILYASGRGVPQDYVEAHTWFNLAAASASNVDARKDLIARRDALASVMTREQVAEAQRLAREWKPK